ncbi:MAG TPA: Xaa-Pro peptidase family protein [Candidatus Sumerlaeota bacterium]|nr:Xaa-Pro peptidase family protein [Candidatus Sumerlaeota bacterium]HPS01145.1 Xaa-Pro peptidase family protein [Candidatus Sumerlaeota bacterium]
MAKAKMNQTDRMATEYARRIERLERKVARAKLDVLLVVTDINRFYLTGFHSTNAVLAIEPGADPVFFTDFRYLEMARKAVKGAKLQMLGGDKDQLAPWAAKRGWKRVGFEGQIPTLRFEALKKSVPDATDWVESSQTIVDLRVIKSPVEQNILRRAIHLADDVYAAMLEQVRPGITEWEVRRILRSLTDNMDAEGESFDCIVGTGPNSSQCHHHVGQRALKRGEPLLVDMGVLLDSYHSDMTRTVFLGQPNAKLKEIYKVVLEAQLRAIAKVKAGVKASEVDLAARGWIARKGYGENFGHGLGHGVGLEIHEAPSLAAKSPDILRSGMVMTIEPGIYLPGVGGVRIEDVVLVKPNGCEVLTRTPKELIVLDI